MILNWQENGLSRITMTPRPIINFSEMQIFCYAVGEMAVREQNKNDKFQIAKSELM